MLLLLIFSVMTAAAIAAVLVPLIRNRAEEPSNPDIAVYRDQLDEVDRDMAAGLIGKNEAEAARVEISRRLLAADAAAGSISIASDPALVARFRRYVVAAALFLLPAGAAALYLQLGSPELAITPAAGIVQSENSAEIKNLVARVEAHLQGNPDDGRGWEVLAPVYMQLGRYSDSVNAWRRVLALLGETADRQANFGEALMAEANGVVTVAAKAAFTRSVTLDNSIVSARYYLGRAAEQDGKREEAAQIWRDLIAGAPAGAHWVDDVRGALSRIESSAAAGSGSTGAQIAAPVEQFSEQQAASIREMVNGLAERLKQDGSDVDGWLKLVRSYKVLGEIGKATSAIGDARRSLDSDPGKRKLLEAGLKELDANLPPPAANFRAATPAAAPSQHEGDAIQGTINRLAERLKKSGSDPEGWIMLTRSYISLGEKEKAAETISNARSALAGDEAMLQVFNEALQRFKIDDLAKQASTLPGPPAVESRPPIQGGNQTNEMIRGMVARLAERLKNDGSDLDGWLQLVRSYVVLGERDKALNAATDARRAVGNDAEKRQRIDDFIRSLGLEG